MYYEKTNQRVNFRNKYFPLFATGTQLLVHKYNEKTMNKKKKILKREREKIKEKKSDVGWSSSSVAMENRNSRLRVLTAIIKNKVELPYVTHKDIINNTERQNKSTVKDRINRHMKTSSSQNTHFLKPCDR